MQRIQNICAKLVLNRRKFDSSKQALYDLHWLPVKTRIQFKLLSFMYNCSVGCAPVYLTELLSPQVPNRSGLRSSNYTEGCYAVPFNKRKTFSDRGFSTVDPLLWNTLPLDIKQSESSDVFKRKLKTLYFRDFYSLF